MKPGLGLGTRKPYTGPSRSLVLALDIGTTFSGVSYAILEPGDVPKIHGVTRFPGQEHVAGNSKIPSIMYYDIHGVMKAAGAEADGAAVLAQAEDEGWIKTELFKLRLRPKSMHLKMNGMRLSPLPRHKTAVDVFGDFLSYLFRCTHSFIVDTHANGHAMWRAVEHDIQFVLSHPNGWEGAQQTKMRRAAVIGGLIPDTDEGKARIRFVTEGEASLHACVLNGLADDVLSNPSGNGFLIADAGGGTLDISSYAIRGTAPLVIEEIAPPDCVFAGSVFVSRRARIFFEEKLKSSKYGTADSLDHITKRFDETTKRLFRDAKELQFVPFGSPLDKDMTVGIRGGQLKLTGAEVAALFEPSIMAAMTSIQSQIHASSGQVKSVWLVGGFAASPWLFTQLQERLKPLGVTVSRPDSQTSKAVADGAIGFYCDHHVSARVSKYMYGVEYLRTYDPNDEDHVARKHRLFELPSGPKLLPDAFDCILARGVKVKESTVFSRKYCTEVTNLSTLSVFEVEIWCYRGGDVVPKWIHRSADNFSTLCYVRADLSPLAGSAQSKEGKGGKMYWTIVFSIEIHFGLTEFKARIKWTDNNKIRYGPASIVYNESGHRAEDDDLDSPDDDVTSSAQSRSSHRHRSSASSKVPSTSISRSASRPASVAHSTHSSRRPPPGIPSAPRTPTESRTRTTSQSSHASRPTYDRRSSGISSRAPTEPERPIDSRRTSMASSTDRGKYRERSAPLEGRAASPMSSRDRSANVSGESKVSSRTNATAKLGEALSSVWGAASAYTSAAQSAVQSVAQSALTTPKDSPRGLNASYFDSAPIAQELDYVTPPAQPAPELPPVASQHPSLPASATRTPMPASGVATPRAIPPEALLPPPEEIASAVEAASKPASPPAASKAPTAHTSKVPTPAATPKVATPGATTPKVSTPGAATPRVSASGAATPRPVSKAPSVAATPHPPASAVPSHVATPVGSRAPSKAPSRAPSIAPSKAPSIAPSKAPSKAPSVAATPRAVSRVPSPKPEPEALPEPPVIEESPPAPEPAPEAEPVSPPPPPADTAPVDDDAVIPPKPESDPAEQPEEAHHPEPPALAPVDTTWGDASHHSTAPASAAPGALGDLWATDAKPENTGFADFLTSGAQWEQSKTPTTGPGSNRDSGILPQGAGSKFGLGSLGSWGASAATAAKAASSGWGLGSLTNAFGSGSQEQLAQPAETPVDLPGAFEMVSRDSGHANTDDDKPVIPSKPATPLGSRRSSKLIVPQDGEGHDEWDVVPPVAEESAAAPEEPVALEEQPNPEEAAPVAPEHEAPAENAEAAPEPPAAEPAAAEAEPAPAAEIEPAEDDKAGEAEGAENKEEPAENTEGGEGNENAEDGIDWAPTKKKGKKSGKNTPAAEDMSRTASTATAGGGGGGAKKKGKKGKK